MVVSVFLGQVKLSPLALAFIALLRKFNLCNKTSSLLLQQCSSSDIICSQQPDDIDIDIPGEDMISRLPDDILISIISLIPIRSAVRTSILSNRWRHLHKSVSSISLDCRALLGVPHINVNPNLLINALDRFLRLRSGSKIHHLDLNLCLHDESVFEKLEECIYSIGKSGIERLLLSFCCDYCGKAQFLPYRIISEIPSLRYLRLSCCTLYPSLKIQCDSLIKITLAQVKILPGAIECVLSNCLSLQTLTLTCSKSPSKKLCFRGASLQLKALVISYCVGLEEIEIYASNLVVFEFEGTKMVNFIFDHVPHLHSFFLHIDEEGHVIPYVVQKLSRELPHLKSLNVATHCNIFQRSNKPVWIGMFRNIIRRLDLFVYGWQRMDLLLLTPFLQTFPLLQYFHVHASFNKLDLLPQWSKPAVVFHSELKKMEISGFAGTESDIEFALYILKSSESPYTSME